MRRLAFLATLAALAAVLALACNDSDGSTNGETPDGSTTPGGTATTPVGNGTPAVPTFPINSGEPTPRDLDTARERLSSQLDAIGANIGAVPDDIRDQLLDRCAALKAFANDRDVEAICQTISQAIETNDPGLIDRVLGHLTELEED